MSELTPLPIITLTTDFGLDDVFVGVMKGVILGIAPEASLVDITHAIPSHDILAGSQVLRSSHPFFPTGTIHVVVVDPGVGGSRRPILAVTDKGYFVAPDNGVLSPLFGETPPPEVFHLSNDRYFLKPISTTFHGRDIFAPAAAWLSRGVLPQEFGPQISDPVRLDLPKLNQMGPGEWTGQILSIDKFGNLITNIERGAIQLNEMTSEPFVIELRGYRITRLVQSYSGGTKDQPFGIWGSSGYLEIAISESSAAKIMQVAKGEPFILRVPSLWNGSP
ncbi:MAG: SAM-dependent chlorinase/fluorinase [Acidobacteriota bacterium]